MTDQPKGALPPEKAARLRVRYGGPLGDLMHAFVIGALEADKLHKHWLQFTHANDLDCTKASASAQQLELDALAWAAKAICKAVDEAIHRANVAIDGGGAVQKLTPWRDQAVDTWLVRMMDELVELRQAVYSAVIKTPDAERLNRLPEVSDEMHLAYRHVDNVLLICLRAGWLAALPATATAATTSASPQAADGKSPYVRASTLWPKFGFLSYTAFRAFLKEYSVDNHQVGRRRMVHAADCLVAIAERDRKAEEAMDIAGEVAEGVKKRTQAARKESLRRKREEK